MSENQEETKILNVEDMKFTAKVVAEIEKDRKQPLIQAIAIVELKDIAYFVSKGLNCTVDEAYSAIDRYAEGGKDTSELTILIVEVLEKQGFLAKALELSQQLRQRIKKVGQELAKQEVSISEKSGLKEKQLQ